MEAQLGDWIKRILRGTRNWQLHWSGFEIPAMVSSPYTASRMLIENLAQVNAALQNAAKAKHVIRIGR
jgi:hypothetical protein